MPTTTRRALVKTLLSLPIVAQIAKLNVFASVFPANVRTEESLERDEKGLLAIRILRLINSAQYAHFQAFSHYVDVKKFSESEAIKEYLNSEWPEKWGIGRSLYSTLRFDHKEIIPGWKFGFKLGDSGQTYMVTLHDAYGKESGAFSSSDQGIIYEGKSLASIAWQSEHIGNASSVLVAGRVIGFNGQRPGRLSSFLMTVALGGALSPQCGDHCGTCCTCYACCPRSDQYCRRNCGCYPCTWCTS